MPHKAFYCIMNLTKTKTQISANCIVEEIYSDQIPSYHYYGSSIPDDANYSVSVNKILPSHFSNYLSLRIPIRTHPYHSHCGKTLDPYPVWHKRRSSNPNRQMAPISQYQNSHQKNLLCPTPQKPLLGSAMAYYIPNWNPLSLLCKITNTQQRNLSIY